MKKMALTGDEDVEMEDFLQTVNIDLKEFLLVVENAEKELLANKDCGRVFKETASHDLETKSNIIGSRATPDITFEGGLILAAEEAEKRFEAALTMLSFSREVRINEASV